jgi:hypothetical protein
MLAAIILFVAGTGLVLGLRFNVFVLSVLLLLVTASIFVIAVWSTISPIVFALHLLATLASFQIGFLVGCVISAQLPAPTKTLANRMQTRYSRKLSARA